MTGDYISFTDKLIIAAMIVGPILAVLISVIVQNLYLVRAQKRQAKLYVLGQIISNRHDVMNADSVKAMNTIDLVFSNKRDAKVRNVWKEFVSAVRNAGVTAEDKLVKYNELITEMCNSLGYGNAFSYLDATRVLVPGVPQQPVLDPVTQELQQELLRFLKETAIIVAEKRAGETEQED